MLLILVGFLGACPRREPPWLGQVGISTQDMCPQLWLSLMPVHVCQPSKAGTPVPEVVIVLVFISQAG